MRATCVECPPPGSSPAETSMRRSRSTRTWWPISRRVTIAIGRPREDIARCLRAGKDVVCTSLVPMCYPPAADTETVDLLRAACTEGGTSFFNSGVDPGWANDVIALTMTGSPVVSTASPCSRSRLRPDQSARHHVRVHGICTPADHPAPLFDTTRLAALWAPTVHLVADGVGLPLDRVDTSIEKWLATERYEVASGWVEPGTMGGMRFKLAGIVDGEERVVLEHITRMGEGSAPDWPRHPSPHGGYRVIVDGLPTYTVDIEMHGSGNNMRGLTYATVMRELNAIPRSWPRHRDCCQLWTAAGHWSGARRNVAWYVAAPNARMSREAAPPISADLWTIMSTSSAVRRYRDEPVDDQVLERCLQAATWAPSEEPAAMAIRRSAVGAGARTDHEGGAADVVHHG